jgi:hypothetical protein
VSPQVRQAHAHSMPSPIPRGERCTTQIVSRIHAVYFARPIPPNWRERDSAYLPYRKKSVRDVCGGVIFSHAHVSVWDIWQWPCEAWSEGLHGWLELQSRRAESNAVKIKSDYSRALWFEERTIWAGLDVAEVVSFTAHTPRYATPPTPRRRECCECECQIPHQ